MLKSQMGRGYRARATRTHFARLPTEVPIPHERRNPVPEIGANGMRWYVCTTVPQQERRAADSLRREAERLAGWGLPPLVPYVPCETLWQARKRGPTNLPRREIQRPVARSYCFVGALGGLRAAHLNIMSERNVERQNRHGLIAVLGSRDGIPLCLPSEDLKFLTKSAKDEVDAIARNEIPDAPDFDVGDTVNVTDGSFAAQGGHVVGIDMQQRRALIELEIFGRAVPIELNFENVAKAA
jgi:transcription antitermination factor NusG